MPRKTYFGKKLFEVHKTPGQLWWRRFWVLLLSGFFPCTIGILLILGGAMEFSLHAAALVVVLALLAALPLPQALKIKHSEAILYEDGLVYTLDGKTTEVAFKDVKGTRFLITSNPRETTIRRSARLIKHDDTIVEMDGEAAVLRNFRQFYEKLDSVFADYLLRNITPENLHQANISFGSRLELTDGQFIYYDNWDKITTMPLENVTGIDPPANSTSISLALSLKGPFYKRKAVNFASIDLIYMLNIQALYRVVEMAKQKHKLHSA